MRVNASMYLFVLLTKTRTRMTYKTTPSISIHMKATREEVVQEDSYDLAVDGHVVNG